MRRTFIHLAAITAAALAVRLAGALYSPYHSGMTKDYTGPCYMLACGYGYNRPGIDRWHSLKEELAEHSMRLAAEGKQLSRADRPELKGEPLRPLLFRTPGYPAFLLAVYRLFGEPLLLHAGIVQAVLGALHPLLVYLLAMGLLRRRGIALGAAWATALYPPIAFAAVMRLPGGMAILLVLAAAVCVQHGAERKRYWAWMAAAGLLISASCYFRTNGMLLWVFLAAALLWRQGPWRRPLISTAVLAAGIYLGMLPWAVRNHQRTGRWIWGSTGTGMTLWKSIGEYPNPWGIKVDDVLTTRRAKAEGFESDLTPEADQWFRRQVSRHVRERPGFFVAAALKRLPWMAAAPFDTGYVNPYRTKGMFSYYLNQEHLRPHQVLLRHPGYVLRAYWERLLVMACSAFGTLSLVALVVVRRRRPSEAALTAALPAYYVLLHAATVFAPRYLTVIIPLQIIASAWLVTAAWHRLRRRGRPTIEAAPRGA